MPNKILLQRLILASASLALLALAYVVMPRLLAQRFGGTLTQISGLTFSSQAARFEFAPPGVLISQSRLSNAQGQVMAEADALHVPLAALWGGTTGAALSFENAALHSYAVDGREHFTAAKIFGTATLAADGGLMASGSGDVGLTHVTAELSLVSLARAFTEGSPADLTLASKLARATYSGRIKLKDGFDLAGTFSLETADAREFLASLGAVIPALQRGWPLEFSAGVETREGILAFANLEGRLGSMKALGNATYGWPGGKPKLTFDLGMDLIDLSLFGLGNPSTAGAWSEKAFDLTAFDSVDAIWHISSNGLKIGSVVVGAGELDGSLKDRIFEASYGAKSAPVFTGHVSLDGQGFQPALEMSLKAADLDGKAALASFAGFDWLTGLASISAKLSSEGVSPAALVAKLSGNLDVQLKDGRVAGVAAASLVQAANEQPVNGWNGGFTEGIKAQGTVNFSDGIGTLDQANLEAPGLSVAISGEVDLLRQALDLKLLPRLGSAKPGAAILVTGAWENPKFLADKTP